MMWRTASAWLLFATSGVARDDADVSRELVRKAMANYMEDSRRLRDYLFERRTESREYMTDGSLKTKTSRLMSRELIDGVVVGRIIQRDDRPLPRAEEQKVHAAAHKAAREYLALTPEQRRKKDSGPSGEIEFLREMPDGLDYRYSGSEWVESREILRLDFEPRANHRPRNMQARLFQKVRGTIWLDKTDGEMQRLNAEVFDNVSIGGILARVGKGTRFYFERQRMPDRTWVPLKMVIRFDVKVMLVKTVKRESESVYSGFRLVTPVNGSVSAQ